MSGRGICAVCGWPDGVHRNPMVAGLCAKLAIAVEFIQSIDYAPMYAGHPIRCGAREALAKLKGDK